MSAVVEPYSTKNLKAPVKEKTMAVKNLLKATSINMDNLKTFERNRIGPSTIDRPVYKTPADNSVSYARANGRPSTREPWRRDASEPRPSLRGGLNRSNVNIYQEYERTMSAFKTKNFHDQRRYDQTEKPIYPNFEPTQKHTVLGNTGWGIDKQNLQYKFAHPQEGIDRQHLKFLDQRLPSNYAGGLAGFQESKSSSVMLDMSPEQYHINFPADSRIPLNSLEMQR